MGYGTLVYRRPSGIYAFRLSVPDARRRWFDQGEIHRSTHHRERARAITAALQLRLGWTAILEEMRVMDLTAFERGTPLTVGDGVIAIGDVAAALRADVLTVALELANSGAKFFVFAEGWSAVSYNGPLCNMWREDGEIPFVEVENVGEECSLRGLVELSSPSDVALRLKHGALSVEPYHVIDSAFGTCFVARPPARRVDRDLIFVRKPDVSAWRESVLAAVRLQRPVEATPSPAPALPITAVLEPMAVHVTASVEPVIAPSALSPVVPAAATHTGRFASMRMSVVADKFVQAMSTAKPGGVASWKSEEASRNRNKLAVFCELTGDPTMGDLQTVPESEELIELFLERASAMPTGPMLTKARAVTGNGTATAVIAWADQNGVVERMNLRTVKQSYLSKASECLKWAQKKGYVSANPCANVFEQTQLDPSAFQCLERKPLSTDDLQLVFGAEWFRFGGPSPTAAGKPAKNFRSFHYWLPLLGIYTGGRINELSQLYLDDFKVTREGEHYIAFTLDRPDKKADEDGDDVDPLDAVATPQRPNDKSLKTSNSRRDVPIHDELIRLGLIRYVEALRSAGQERLFPELRYDSLKGYGADSRKWFNDRFLGNTLGIPRDGTRVFHSLRHNFVMAARHAGLGLRERQQLVGHKRGGDNTMDNNYDHDDELSMLRPKLCMITYPLPAIAPFEVRAGLAAVRYSSALKISRARRQNSTKIGGA